MRNTFFATEDQEQKTLMDWARLHPICKEYLIHIPNQRKCSVQYGRKLKALGVKAGVADLFLAYPYQGYSGLWIEMKRKKGAVVSTLQIKWLKTMADVGYKAVIARGADEAIKFIEEYLTQ